MVTRNILVTGASSGIGRAAARKFLEQGHHVYGVSREQQKFSTKHTEFTALILDLAKLDALPKNIAQWPIEHAKIDSIVFCAGYGQFGSLEQFSYQQMCTLMDVNFMAQAVLARYFISSLRKKTRADLIFIGSEAALQGRRNGTLYCASKFALRGFSQALREECASSGVKVSLINPGMVNTEFFEALDFEPGVAPENYIVPEDVAEAISYVLTSQAGIVIDEINLNPRNKVVRFK